MYHRRLKIHPRGDFYAGKIHSEIVLKGYWLKDAGFEPMEYVTVTAEPGRLVIETTTAPLKPQPTAPAAVDQQPVNNRRLARARRHHRPIIRQEERRQQNG